VWIVLVVDQMANRTERPLRRERVESRASDIWLVQRHPGGDRGDPVVARRLREQVVGVRVEACPLDEDDGIDAVA
jgi:hypothetical protein